MTLIKLLRRRPPARVRRMAGPAIAMLLFGYFVFHAVQGERGMAAIARLRGDVRTAETELAAARAERLRLEGDVNLLRAQSLDPDLLEERARAVLNYIHPDEVIILPAGPAGPAGPND